MRRGPGATVRSDGPDHGGWAMQGFPRWVIPIAIIPIIAVGGFILRDRLSGAAQDLAVGDCFDAPTTEAEVQDVQHRPCNEAHTAEVIFVGEMPEADALPGGTEIDDYIAAQCIPAFNAYTGRDYATDRELDISSLTPTSSGWQSGDREVSCFAVRIDGAAMTASVKGT